MFVGCGEQIRAQAPVVSTCGYVPETEMMCVRSPLSGWQVSDLDGRLGQVMLSPLAGVPTRSFFPRILTREEGSSMDTSNVTHMCEVLTTWTGMHFPVLKMTRSHCKVPACVCVVGAVRTAEGGSSPPGGDKLGARCLGGSRIADVKPAIDTQWTGWKVL